MKYDINAVIMGEDKQCRRAQIGVDAQGAPTDQIVILRLSSFEGEGTVSFRLNDLLSGVKLPKGSTGDQILDAALKKRQAEEDAQAEAVVMRRPSRL